MAVDNPRLVYGLLFEAASASVQELAADPKQLGAQVGLVAVRGSPGREGPAALAALAEQARACARE